MYNAHRKQGEEHAEFDIPETDISVRVVQPTAARKSEPVSRILRPDNTVVVAVEVGNVLLEACVAFALFITLAGCGRRAVWGCYHGEFAFLQSTDFPEPSEVKDVESKECRITNTLKQAEILSELSLA